MKINFESKREFKRPRKIDGIETDIKKLALIDERFIVRSIKKNGGVELGWPTTYS